MKANVNIHSYDLYNGENKVFSFTSNRSLTPLDIRKLQLASIFKGAWCESMEEVAEHLSYLHVLEIGEIGKLVSYFQLFNQKSKIVVSFLPEKITYSLAKNYKDFLLTSFSRNETVPENPICFEPVKYYFHRWKILNEHGIYLVSDLLNYSPSDLMKLPSISTKTVYEIEQLLSEFGLCLEEENT